MGNCTSKSKQQREPQTGKMIVRSQIDTSQFIRLDSKLYLDIRKHYKFLKFIGHGHFGTVRLAVPYLRKKKLGTHKYAVKTIPKSNIGRDLLEMRRELSILSQSDHPNIITLADVFEDELSLHLVMEYCNGGDLLERLVELGTMNENQAGRIVDQVLSGLGYLHNNNIVHRDLKPANLIFANKQEDACIKIIDFGLSKKFGVNRLHTVVGTPYYIAPEVLSKKYGTECDIWSLGVILYVMLSGNRPFEASSPFQVYRKIKEEEVEFKGDVWADISQEAKQLISQMLIKKPQKRIKIPEILQHSWYLKNQKIKEMRAVRQVIRNMKTIKAPSKFKQVAMKVIIKHLDLEQIQDLTHAFQLLDTDKTGYISIDDLRKIFIDLDLKIAQQEVDRLIQKFSWIQFGQINYSDFVFATINQKRVLDEEQLYEAFKHFDVDNTGFITKENLISVLENNQYYEIVEDSDYEFPQKISFEQFKQLMLEESSPIKRSQGRGKSPISFNSIYNNSKYS